MNEAFLAARDQLQSPNYKAPDKKPLNIFSRATLGNTRAVARYLARYTSRIAMSNQRITRITKSQTKSHYEFDLIP